MTKTIKTMFRAIAVVLGLAIAVPLFASAVRTRVNIPFAFEASDATMPAGQYTFERNHAGWQVYVTSPTGETRAFMTTPVGNPNTPFASKLVFEKLGETYRLAEVHLTGAPTGLRIPPTKAQIEIAKKVKPHRVEIALVRP